jgi:uncharacterized protein YndB with AHSA1/START domain
MPDILHRVGARATPQQAFEALTTLDGLSRWWITGTTGDAGPGGTIHFRLEGGGFDMLVLEARPGALVRWRCTKGPPEWIGTELTFRLRAEGEGVLILFTHAGWREAVEFMHHCSTKWAVFLLSLKSLLETGKGTPWPDVIKLDSWE